MLTRDVSILTGAGFARRSVGIAIGIATLAWALAGCGQKGTLVPAKPLPPAAAASSTLPPR